MSLLRELPLLLQCTCCHYPYLSETLFIQKIVFPSRVRHRWVTIQDTDSLRLTHSVPEDRSSSRKKNSRKLLVVTRYLVVFLIKFLPVCLPGS